MKKGILFDMDGTLWDSAQNVAKAWDEWLQKEEGGIRRITTEDVKAIMGLTMTAIAERMFPMLEKKEAVALLDRCGAYENAYLARHGGNLYPGLQETLRILVDQYPLYIVSNCQSGYIEAFLAYYGLEDYFCDTECFGNNGLEKSENIAQVVKRNHLDRAIYVGDIQADYEASQSAGTAFIHAAYGFGKIEEPVPSIHHLNELPQVAAEVFKTGDRQ
jgi:phosphoglycolate phosphatase